MRFRLICPDGIRFPSETNLRFRNHQKMILIAAGLDKLDFV